ncbi:NACHT, LRR and PYD domains-containing protein 3-like isoform X3 [Sphaeramia orbicularis]|uniref:NACHT, LRR and PYD domains-containing protein 3-like isoform X3 n=1 Tax=Sphaeramia orbicularis TaxID=375764 RepID=UPI00117F4235|nr:NACHT, LRR and PYD domains-containing protein 3-like isoform X3 [Sphaeramia orbicularis]
MASPEEALLGALQQLGEEEFKTFRWYLQQKGILKNFPTIPKYKLEKAERTDTVDVIMQTYGTDAVQVTKMVLTKMKRYDLEKKLTQVTSRSTENLGACQQKLKSKLKQRFRCVSEGVADEEEKPKILLDQIFTELYITEGGATEVNDEHEVRQIEAASRKPDRPQTAITCNDIFKTPPDRDEPIRRVLTKGVAGIGKTVLTQKFSLDWAEDKANQDIHFIFPFTFRELNELKQEFSLVELVHYFFNETEEAGICSFKDHQVVFILDGLDECRPPLDFNNTQILTDVTESSSVDVLLMNLMRGNLLPSAHLWITTRPAAANQIPAQWVDMVTEIRGFTDPQKEEYFRKRFTDEEQANTIIFHIKTSRSVHNMCHIPVFCWITANVLENVLKTMDEGEELPKTLTEMYIHFLVVQAKLKNVKYDGRSDTDPHWTPETRKMIESLGKLAFEQLKKGNLIFYEKDLTECGIDISSALVHSGVFKQVFKKERGGYRNKVFCFVHLSFHEFLAALHVHQTFVNSGVNLLSEETWRSKLFRRKPKLRHLHQTAVDQALQSPNGHLDLFLRFLLGLSLETNQSLIQDLLTQTGSGSETKKKTVEYIKKKISENLSVERSINLFHCLNELEDRSLVDQIPQYLRSGRLSTDRLSPAQWSALVFILLSSEKDLDVFDLKKYSASEEVLLRLLPVVKASNRAVLTDCGLSQRSCEPLSSVLSSQSSSLRHLDMSNNNLGDSGVKVLSAGLESPNCHLEILGLSGCQITEEGCSSLVSALRSNPSHLRELDLSHNYPGDSAVKLLEDPCLKLDTLRLVRCGLSERSCEPLFSVLSSQSSSLRHLDLSHNDLGDSGEKVLSAGLESPNCHLETLRLTDCGLSQRSCEPLSSVLSSQSSSLRHLDMSHNNLGDSGVKVLSAGLESPNCHLETLRLSGCQITEEGCSSLVSALRSNPSHLRELDLSHNYPGDSAVKLLEDPCLKLDTLRLVRCGLSERSCEPLSSVLSSQSSSLRHLDMSHNDLKDSGVKVLSTGLESPNCHLETLRLSGCQITEEGCSSLVSALRSNPSHLRELDLSHNYPGDSAVKLLEDPCLKLDTLRLVRCGLSERSCEPLSSVLSSQSSSLRHLDMSHNDLKDSGVKVLSTGLESPNCHLETLRLSGCQITEEGCSSLASALRSNPSHLRALDLSQNHPGDSAVKLLEDPCLKLDTLRLDHVGPHTFDLGLKNYFCELTLDVNSGVHRDVRLSADNRTVTRRTQVPSNPAHSGVVSYEEVTCSPGLTGRCYWEVDWSGKVFIAVTQTQRRNEEFSQHFGFMTDWSLRLYCNSKGYFVRKTRDYVKLNVSASTCGRVMVFVDCSAGRLTFSTASSGKPIHLYEFKDTFTPPLCVSFGVWPGSSVSLCDVFK